MNIESIKNTLNQSFHNLEEIAPNIFCATEKYHDKPYAVRYFDLSDKVASYSEGLNEYLENVLGKDYFDVERPIDLRWNNYLYFITSETNQNDVDFLQAKHKIESNREYARKFVITETELQKYIRLAPRKINQPAAPVQDLYSTWLKLLNEEQLGYILDFNLKIPEIVREIGDGKLSKLEQTTSIGQLNTAEQDAINKPLQKLNKIGFREHPKGNEFEFGSRVNLITGPNGHGKTSLLETIEYLYCGTTYRNGQPHKNTNISASLINSEEILETDSELTRSRQLKARNLGWYGKNDLRGNSLDKSFARFNFMDTDAAIRFAHEETPENLSEDIARIVLGAEAGKASDQIQRIHFKLENKLRENSNIDHQISEKLQLLESEKDLLNSTTKQSDTLFLQINQNLKRMNWVEQLINTDNKTINTISENLASANHQCKLLERSNFNDLKKQRQELESNNLSLAKLIDTSSKYDADLKLFTKNKEQIIKKIEIITELQTYSGSNLLSLEQQQIEHMTIVNTLSTKIPDLKHLDLIDSKISNLSLDNALTEILITLSKIIAEKSEILIKIEEHERSQTAMENLHEQLISTATTILKSSPNKDHCPLCHTHFEEGQLMLRIVRNTKDDATNRSTELRNKLSTLQTSEETFQQIEVQLAALIRYFEGNSIASISLALTKLKEDKQKNSEYQESLELINTNIASYSEKGLKISRLKELIGYLEITEDSPNELNILQQTLYTKSKELTKAVNSKKMDLDDTSQKISTLAERLGMSKSVPATAISENIYKEIKSCDQKIEAAIKLGSYIKLENNFSAVELIHQVNEVRDIVSKFITTRKQEEETNNRTQYLIEQIKVNKNNLLKIKTTVKRLSRASDILSRLLSGPDSVEGIKYELLSNNEASISEIFSKIHLPNEYEIKIDEGIKLVHKISGESRSLQEVSTGQRTAFALSLFLTMNKTLENGPRVLLLDDPISHVDDVNMLSFLDYLRELAIDGNRQIFFATPNTKLASLFRHKFGFLNDSEFKVIHLTR